MGRTKGTRNGYPQPCRGPAASPAEPVGQPLRILVAEDNEFNRDLLEHMLAGQGLTATMAVDGREAWPCWSATLRPVAPGHPHA